MKKDEDRKGMEVTNPPKVGKTDSDFQMEEDTGVQAGNKVKKPAAKKKVDPGKEIKLSAGNSTKVVNELKKMGIRIS